MENPQNLEPANGHSAEENNLLTQETLNMNKNAASQTLFRFVSLRNPQLTETTEDNIGFIFRAKNRGKRTIEGIFDGAIASWSPENGSKFAALINASNDYSATAFKSEKDFENTNFAEFLKLGQMIVKNENLESYDRATLETFYLPNGEDTITLWDNLFYQTVTQENFYVKEAIVQILKAMHFVAYTQTLPISPLERNVGINGGDILTKVLKARVVLPANLFLDETDTEKSPFDSAAFIVDQGIINQDFINPQEKQVSQRVKIKLEIEAKKNQEINKAKYLKSELETLKTELEKVQESFYKKSSKAYIEAYAVYQEQVQPIIESNKIITENLEEGFEENTSAAAKNSAYKNLELAEVPGFDFSYKNEVNFPDLQAQLPATSFGLFLNLFAEADQQQTNAGTQRLNLEERSISFNKLPAENISDDSVNIEGVQVTLNEDYLNFTNVLGKIQEQIEENTKILYQKESPKPKQFASLGGVLVPISKATSGVQPLTYTFNPFSDSNFFWSYGGLNFSFYVEDSSWSLASGKITATTDTGNYENAFSDILVVDNVITLPAIITADYNLVATIKIEIFFNNGRESVLELANVNSNEFQYGFLNLNLVAGKQPTSFTPKHFGVKRLGIADYLKVEQSVHAYVPGEVSNIENVMASELRQKNTIRTVSSEETTDKTTSLETEHVSDTTTATRNDMQTEIDQMLQNSSDIGINTNTSYTGVGKRFTMQLNASYANHKSKEDSTRQAVEKSQEITARAMDRIVSKVTEERITKIINTFSESNTHEFDNRGDGINKTEHITGVYRWVDKKMKNQIYNYGKRMMFEFMIPEPARLHKLGLLSSSQNLLTAPQDPRTVSGLYNMTLSNITEDNLKYWAGIYGISLTETLTKTITHSVGLEYIKLSGDNGQRSKTITFPENYAAKTATVYYGYQFGSMYVSNFKGDIIGLPWVGRGSIDSNFRSENINLAGEYAFLYRGDSCDSFNVSFAFDCALSDAYMANWNTTNFNNIITAYTQAKTDYDQKVADLAAQAAADQSATVEKATVYYRDMEAETLKHNCIAYLLGDYLNILGENLTDGDKMGNFNVLLKDDLDNYTSLAKFMEQAFEWNIMSYDFYPYFWGSRENWQEMYLSADTDALFRNFLQAGMGRVIVTVNPGFEDAVQFFMSTGKIWNGGEVPVIGDPMYLSIVDELREPQGIKQGNYWITRIPTALTILQAKSVGLEVTEALPIFVETDPENCDNPEELENKASFSLDEIAMVGSSEPSKMPKEINNVYNEKTIIQS